jgi:hypothetical protein
MIEQAVYGSQGAGGYRFQAVSPGFRDEWRAEAEKLCTGFGERPPGVRCPGCVFARPLDSGHVAVVQAADQGADDTGRPGALGFRLLVLPAGLYRDLGADPFLVADHFPPPWGAGGELPALEWTAGTPPPRTVVQLRPVLEAPHVATLLGGVQALLDGGRLVFERPEPDERLVRGLWSLLPDGDRAELWPASFAFSNAHRFHLLVVPRANGPEYEHYIPEEQAGDYPEGRYERALEVAVMTGNQRDLDALLARRSRAKTLKLLLALLAACVVVAFLTARVPPPAAAPTTIPHADALVLPPPEACPRLAASEREALAARLQGLARRLDLPGPAGTDDDNLAAALAAIDRRMGTPDARHDPGTLGTLGPLQRQVRALLWKHGVPGYGDPGLNTAELIDRLTARLESESRLKEK